MIHEQENKVCNLDNDIKQAPNKWHEKFDNLIISNGYKVNKSDTCIYYKYGNNNFTLICFNIDDILILG